MNIYRRRYQIPNDLMVRKADRDIRVAVESSEAIKKLESLITNGIHPSLIFFAKDMPEEKIIRATARLHGTPQEQNLLLEISAILSGGNPQICLMFHGGKKFFIRNVPGFISVPYNFEVKRLKEYTEENIMAVRDHAREYVKTQKTRSRID